MSARVRDLLIVDDDIDQAKLFEILLVDLGFDHRCHYAGSGSAAVAFLRKDPPYEDAPRPDLIILDVNMPGLDGCDTLRLIKSDPRLRCIPVVMFSASTNDDDMVRCYKQHANAYVRKPSDLESSLAVVRQIERFWFGTARLPV